MRTLAVATAVTIAFAAAAAGAPGAAAPGEEMYYGRTSQGRAVAIDIRADRTEGPAGKLLYLHRFFLMQRGDTQKPLPSGARVVGNAVQVHTKVVGRANMSAEIWFDARRSPDRRTFAGAYRDVITLQDGKKMPSGTIRFSATLWASSSGAEWSGTRSDGRPIGAAVTVLPSPEDAPRYAIAVPELTLPLSCTDAAGSATDTTVTVRALKAALEPVRRWAPPAHGEYMFEHGLSSAGAAASATATTPEGIEGTVSLVVSRLRWTGTGLAATGTATVGGGGGGTTCRKHSVDFTLHPGPAS